MPHVEFELLKYQPMQNVRANSPKLYGEILKYRKGSKYLVRLNPNPHHYKYFVWLQRERGEKKRGKRGEIQQKKIHKARQKQEDSRAGKREATIKHS